MLTLVQTVWIGTRIPVVGESRHITFRESTTATCQVVKDSVYWLAARHVHLAGEFPQIQITPGTHEMRVALLGTLGDPRTEQETQANAQDAKEKLTLQLRACHQGSWE